MDETDVGILRELGRDQVGGWGRLDPRVSAGAIARRVGVARSTVSRRLQRWQESGFLLGFDLWPNPDLFEGVLAAGSVRVVEPTRKPGVVASLSEMDRVAGVLDHLGEWVGVGLVADGPGGLGRTARLLRDVKGVDEVETGPVFQPPETEVEMSPLDWRVLAAAREDPRGPVHEAADRAGVSTRTFRRRYGDAIRGNGVLLLLQLDFRRWAGGALTRFVLHLGPDRSRSAVGKRVEGALPASMFINNSLRPEPEQPWPVLDVVSHLDGLAVAADLRLDLLDLEGVQEVEVLFPRKLLTVSHWVRQRIQRRVGD